MSKTLSQLRCLGVGRCRRQRWSGVLLAYDVLCLAMQLGSRQFVAPLSRISLVSYEINKISLVEVCWCIKDHLCRDEYKWKKGKITESKEGHRDVIKRISPSSEQKAFFDRFEEELPDAVSALNAAFSPTTAPCPRRTFDIWHEHDIRYTESRLRPQI